MEESQISAGTGREPLLAIRGLTLSFPGKCAQDPRETAVNGVSFDVGAGEIVGVVGESGSGKSVTSLAVMGLLPKNARIDAGSIRFAGKDLLTMSRSERRGLMGSRMAMIFQEPMTSLNPVMRIGEQVAENLELHTDLGAAEIQKRVIGELKGVGLTDAEQLIAKYPHELSGGMRQRVMIALAAICRPELIIADEPTTALDVVVQEQILRLLGRINREKHISILFISHDLNVIRRIASRVIVMYHGSIVEQGRVQEIFSHPKQEYTRQLVSRIPEQADHGAKTEEILRVEHLNVYYDMGGGLFRSRTRKHVIHDVTFNLHEGEILGVVGESGCGKSTLSKAILGLHTNYDGKIWMRENLRPQMVFQDPYSSLNPAHTVGWIMTEPLRVRGITDRRKQREMVDGMLTDVGLDPSYAERRPSDLSGGQRQRISIGTALLMDSGFIIADEPVSALDVTVQSQIVRLLLRLHEEKNMAILFISHDLEMVRRICRRVLVIYRGGIVEAGRSEDVYGNPLHPYTKMLLRATEVRAIAGSEDVRAAVPPRVPDDYPGCPFCPRCEFHKDICERKKPEVTVDGHNHAVRCFLAEDDNAFA